MSFPRIRNIAVLAMLTAGLSACSNDMSDLETWVAQKKAERVPFVPDMPVVKPYEIATYTAVNLRSPFQNSADDQLADVCSTQACADLDLERNREHLESFALDSLRMVGSLATAGQNTALVQTTDGLIHRVQPGNYIGENHGKIVAVTDSSIEIIEIVPDGLGNYIEREAGIGFSD